MKKYKDILAKIVLLVFLLSADQTTKYIIRSSGGFYVCNKNLALGIQLGSSTFYILWMLVIFIIIHLLTGKIRDWDIRSISYIFILSGAFGNMLDRFFYGCVIDFIDLKFWPVFNLADVFITAGVIMILTKLSRNRFIN